MGWINLGRLLSLLRRRGISPYRATVYWDEQVDADFRHPPPPYSESAAEPGDDEDQHYDDEED